MSKQNTDITELNIKQLLDGSDKYMIPIYQRNYAWEEKEIEQLIQDIIDYIPSQKLSIEKDYYLGTLIINKKAIGNEYVYETIDGQQRLTTLSILTSIIKNNYGLDWYNDINLTFESRSKSTDTLLAVYQNNINNSRNKDLNDNIVNGNNLILKHLDKKLLEADVDPQTFVDFLYSKVKIVRVQVPEDTDLNHYFEIMNTRGEQLEKHEVLKATLLNQYNQIDDLDERHKRFSVFNTIWEATSDMNYYMQYRFITTTDKKRKDTRTEIFGEDWNCLEVDNYLEIYEILGTLKDSDTQEPLSIDKIIHSNKTFNPELNEGDESERFTTIINFPNFLLHVLRVQEQSNDVILDDKKLLQTFDTVLKEKTDTIQFVDDFIFNLFKMRFLFDKYIIKREVAKEKEAWSLKTLKRYEKSKASYVNTFEEHNQNIIMAISMFNVSTPTLIYKHWLNAALFYLFNHYNEQEIDSNNYLNYLQTFAKDLLLHRHLSQKPVDYFDLIYTPDILQLKDYEVETSNPKLIYGKIENNLVFNLLDYILWNNKHEFSIDPFEFTFRSSVEHYYPQNPIGGEPLKDKNALHSFGNLCLISHSKNSKLNNHLPTAKKNYFEKSEGKLEMDSIKLNVMMKKYDPSTWGIESIQDHNEKMINQFNNFTEYLNNE